jgi:protein-tyrosine phosphatase
MKILMVCLGNICRSPLAEGILKHKLEQLSLSAHVDSAGTGNYHQGEKPDHRSIATAMQYGIDISKQKARQIKPIDFQYFDRIYVMDESNRKNVLSFCPEDQQHKIKLILSVLPDFSPQEVPDPYWDSLSGFEKVYQMLDKACDQIIATDFQ